MKDPMVATDGCKVFGFDPAARFLGMPSFRPAPQCLEDGMVNGTKGCHTDDMPVIVCPTGDDRVEHRYQLSSWRLFVGLYRFPDLIEERFHVLLRRLDEQLAVVLAYVLAQKVEPILNVRDAGLFLR